MADDTVNPNPAGPLAAVEVLGLFGKFDYRIELYTRSGRRGRSVAPLFAANEDRLTLIYGKNGSGKTTLMRLLYHALSPASNRGHRHALGRAPFSKLSVETVDGALVEYEKSAELGPGRMIATVDRGGDRATWDYAEGAEHATRFTTRTMKAGPATFGFEQGVGGVVGGVMVDPATGYVLGFDSGEQRFLAALAGLGINPVFLADTRVLESDLTEPDTARDRTEVLLNRGGMQVDRILEQQRNQDVADALERVRTYLMQLVYSGAARGSERVDTIYTNLVQTLVEHNPVRGRPSAARIPGLIDRVTSVAERVAPYAAYRLMPALPVRSLLRSLRRAEQRQGPLLEDVLTPYLDGVEERMAAFEPGLRAIESYVDTVNSFFEGKQIQFNAPTGVEVRDADTGETLEPSVLSSGEKQILLLFSDVVALKETTRLFIIDEPELSLNPSWQRMMMPSLLRATAGSSMQIVAATHSIELMARYRSRLRALEAALGETPADRSG